MIHHRPGAARVALGLMLFGPVLVTGLPQNSREHRQVQTYDELLLRVEEKASGFGGMFTGEDGRLVVYLLEPSKIATARSAIESVFGRDHVPAAGVRALQGQYTVSQLQRWSERATGLLAKPGVTVVDLDEARNRVAIGVADASGTAAVIRALKSLRIPREAVVIDVVGPIRQIDKSRLLSSQ